MTRPTSAAPATPRPPRAWPPAGDDRPTPCPPPCSAAPLNAAVVRFQEAACVADFEALDKIARAGRPVGIWLVISPQRPTWTNPSTDVRTETGYGEVWAKAREKVLGAAEVASLLARRPYDLRQAGVPLWLSSGVDPMQCTRRAGHTIAVLFRVYERALAQTQERANRRTAAALRERNEPE